MRVTFLLVLLVLCCFSCEQQPYQMGERLYQKHCANCHMDGGEGLAGLIPPLAGSDYLIQNRENLACIIRYGLSDTIVVNGKNYSEIMAGNQNLSEIHIANIANYILKAWGNQGQVLRFEEVDASLKACKPE